MTVTRVARARLLDRGRQYRARLLASSLVALLTTPVEVAALVLSTAAKVPAHLLRVPRARLLDRADKYRARLFASSSGPSAHDTGKGAAHLLTSTDHDARKSRRTSPLTTVANVCCARLLAPVLTTAPEVPHSPFSPPRSRQCRGCPRSSSRPPARDSAEGARAHLVDAGERAPVILSTLTKVPRSSSRFSTDDDREPAVPVFSTPLLAAV